MKELVSNASQPLDDGSEPPPVDINALYFEAAGGEKRRRVYGLGSRAASIYPDSCQSSRISYTSQASIARLREIVQQEFADQKAEMDRAIAELAVEKERFLKMQEEMKQFMDQMRSGQQFPGSRSSAP